MQVGHSAAVQARSGQLLQLVLIVPISPWSELSAGPLLSHGSISAAGQKWQDVVHLHQLLSSVEPVAQVVRSSAQDG